MPIVIGLMGYTTFVTGSLWFLIPIQIDFPFNYLFLILCCGYIATHIARVVIDLREKDSEPVWNAKVEAEKERLKGI
jgi:hypothetical protein